MQKPPHVIEIFLQPGDLYFGDRDTRIRTVLGSCVSLTFWHPGAQLGGMCHYMLPSRTFERRKEPNAQLDGRYADEAVLLLMRQIGASGISPREYEVKLFGGGNMFPGRGGSKDHVGSKNVESARMLVQKHGFRCVAEHLGGHGHRNVVFDIWSGDVWVKHAMLDSNEAQGGSAGIDRRQPCVVFE